MLLWLSELLAREVRAFNVFGYLSLRAVLATMTALIISFVIGPRMIAWLTKMRIGQSVRDDGPQTHLIKAGTPPHRPAPALPIAVSGDEAYSLYRRKVDWE